MADKLRKSALFIIAHNSFRDEELFETKEVLEKNGIKTIVASQGLGTAVGSLGGTAKIDADYGAVDVKDFDAVIFIGGAGTTAYLQDPRAHEIAKEAVEQKKVLAAICMAPDILANAGILKGKKATACSEERKNLELHGAVYTGKDVEADGRIITANGPSASKRFGNKIVKIIQ